MRSVSWAPWQLSPKPIWSDADVRAKLSRVSIDGLRSAGLIDRIMSQADATPSAVRDEGPSSAAVDVDTVDDASLFDFMDDLLNKGTV